MNIAKHGSEDHKPRKSFVRMKFKIKKIKKINLLYCMDAAIEYKLKRFYPEGLAVDQKCSARRKAKSIALEHGEVLKREKCTLALSYFCTFTVCLIHSLTTVAIHCLICLHTATLYMRPNISG